jgi:hypothetical protein
MRIPLDHIGYLGPDTEMLVATFRRLGFRTVGPSALATDSEHLPGEPVQRSAHIMFADSYIELTSVQPCPPGHHLAPYQRGRPAVSLLVLKAADAEREAGDLAEAGVAVSAVSEASRRLDYGERATARFLWFSILEDPLPGTLTAFVEHLTREAVFNPEVAVHPNTVTGIDALRHRPGALPDFLAGDEESSIELIESGEGASGNFINGVDLRAHDLGACEDLLRAKDVPYVRDSGCLRVGAEHAAGATLRIRGSV